MVSFGSALFAQGQTVKGRIIDKQSEMPLIGAAVQWKSDSITKGAVTDIDGHFKLEGIPFGRQELSVTYLGYDPLILPNVMVTAGKETVLNLRMEESLTQLDEVVVRAEVDKERPRNELATISARQFSMEEVQRYSGGRSDVGRLAANFAGVSTPDDSRNDIVIRGNSPTGVLWRLEGIPIPNPNHFSTFGTTGGPVSAVNPNLLANSDFLTSAFPAEYGNATAGVFDLNLRTGNRDKNEYMIQLGAVSGLEAAAEGSMGKKGGSFLVSGRYSFVGLATEVGLPIGTNAAPDYQDLTFNLDFANGKAGKFSLFGLLAQSDIDFLHDEVDEDDLFAANDEDSYVTSKLGVVGLKHNYILDNNTYIRTIIAGSTTQNTFDADRYYNLDEEDEFKLRVTTVDNREYRLSVQSFINRKINSRATLRAGILAENYFYDLNTEDRENEPDNDGDGEPDWRTVYAYNESMFLLQAFAQGQYRAGKNWTLNAGLHLQYFGFSDIFALEPRLAVNWNPIPNHTFNAGYGLHHQTQPLPILLLESVDELGNLVRTNQNLDFVRNHHFVLGWDYKPAADWRTKVEVYYQDIGQAGIDREPTSFSTLNVGADFEFPDDKTDLVAEGNGRNYGIELTVEKFFSKGYYGMITGSLYDSEYKGSDDIWRNTAFNNGYVLNILAGKEIPVGRDKRNALTFDTKFTTAGGRYYTPVDLEASQEAGFEIRDEKNAFSEQFDNYLRWDVKFGVRLNSKTKKLSHHFYLDIQNVTNRENVFVTRYNRLTNEVNAVYQNGFFPDFMYRITF
jgi:hypothetical protein